MSHSISNSDDVIDSRDIIARIKELQDSIEVYLPEDEKFNTSDAESMDSLLGWIDEYEGDNSIPDSEEVEELIPLLKLEEEAKGCSDWEYGETLIRESYFEQYAEDLANDCCEMGKATDWPFRHIDWEAAADELKQDYTSVEYDGETYWIRS